MSTSKIIRFKRLCRDAKMPKQAHASDAGFDLFSTRHATIKPGAQALLSTGVAVQLPEGTAGFIWPRSGWATKHMINVHAGLIDQGYRGEVHVCLINHGDTDALIFPGDRIAQMVVSPVFTHAVEVEELDEADRGKNGFGSTGL